MTITFKFPSGHEISKEAEGYTPDSIALVSKGRMMAEQDGYKPQDRASVDLHTKSVTIYCE